MAELNDVSISIPGDELLRLVLSECPELQDNETAMPCFKVSDFELLYVGNNQDTNVFSLTIRRLPSARTLS